MRYGKVVEPNEFMRKVLQKCIDWYDYNPCGGELHVVLDDDNIEDHVINDYEVESDEAKEIICDLKKLNEHQRRWVTYNIYNVMAGKGEREVFEEFDDEFGDDEGNIHKC